MKKLWSYVLIIVLFTTTFFCGSCTVKYNLKVDLSKAEGVEFLEELPESCHPGTSLTVKVPIYTDVDLWAYLDGEAIGKQRPIKTDGEYSHWEFYFTMPEKDATLSFEWKNSDGTHTCYPVCLEESEPTCQTEGLAIIGCSDCGYIYEQTVLPVVDCNYDENGTCIWCGDQLSAAAALLPWIDNLDSENILSIQREERGYGVKPGNLTTVFFSQTKEDKQAIAEYFHSLRLMKVPKEQAQVDGGGGTHLTITTLEGEYSFVVANGYVCVNGEYYQPMKSIPVIDMQETAHRFIIYSNCMQLYKDGVFVNEYENILGEIVFKEIEQVEEKGECEYVLSADGVEIRVYSEKQFSYGDKTYQIIGDVDFSEIVKDFS